MSTPQTARSTAHWMRSLRAITGLYVLWYVTLHLLNLSIGLVSLDAMEAARPYLSSSMTGPVLGEILLLALLVHYFLGLWAIYRRPSISGTSQDVVQALSGLVIIPLMATHVVGVSALSRGNVEVTYELINRTFWLSNPGIGLTQVLLISVVWVHGCAGLFMWLRAWPRAVRVLPWLYPLAVAIPVLALLGYTQAGRAVLAEGLGPVVVQQPLADGSAPPPIDYAAVKQFSNWTIWISGLLGALVLAARGLRSWLSTPAPVQILTTGVGRITGRTGQTMLDAFRAQNQPHANLCAGRGRCGTCAVRILKGADLLPPATPLEQATLDRVDYGPDVRLACQVPLHERGSIKVERVLPPDYSFARDADVPAPVSREARA